ncbi:MAG: tetratricopeptide repeat protein [Paludibacteraceae bacterium]|nr:tetratricopeptide repeat protein [Paludibacteraceae bacterium]
MRRFITILLVSLSIGYSAFAQMNTQRLTAIGRNALYFDDYVLSIQYFNQVIKLKPYLAEPYLFRAIAKIQLGDYIGAERDCSSAIENSPFLPGAYYTRGYVFRQLKQYEKAEKDFTEALVFSPENRTYMLLRADVRSLMEDYDGALFDIDYLLRREPESATLHFERGVIRMAKKDTLEALNSFTESVKHDSQNAANWSAKGVVNSMLGNDDDALLDLNQAINLGSKWAGDYINRGILFYRKHNYRGALSDYDKAISLDPQDAHIYYNRGLLRQELGDYNHAIEDYDMALSLDPENVEVHYQRGVVNMELKQWQLALADFDAMIEHHPYFLPSYYLAAKAEKALGHPKEEYTYLHKAEELERNKDTKARQQVNTSTQMAEAQPQKKDYRKEFSNRAAQNQAENADEQKHQSIARGAVQNKYTDVVNQPSIQLSYYAQQDVVRRSAYYHFTIDDFNRSKKLPSPLRFTVQEIALTAEMVNIHFEQIGQLSEQIDRLPDLSVLAKSEYRISAAELFFARAVEFALVQDYDSAIDDCNRALYLLPSNVNDLKGSDRGLWVAGYFCRANWRFKLLEFQRIAGDETNAEQLKLEFEMLHRDYDQIIISQPDFAYAYYNKANILCLQRDFKAAISYYTSAISIYPDMAEAYFNRGLTYIYTDEHEKGISDLSKAGELGIYQAYNLINRFQ